MSNPLTDPTVLSRDELIAIRDGNKRHPDVRALLQYIRFLRPYPADMLEAEPI